MKGSECKFVKYMEGSDKRFVIPVYQRNYASPIEHTVSGYTRHWNGKEIHVAQYTRGGKK